MAVSVKFNRDLAKFTKRQLEAVEALKSGECKFLLYGGALGGGKSYFLRWYAVRRLLELAMMGHRNVTGMLACEDYPALKDRQLQKIEVEFPAWLGKLHSDHKVYGRSFILWPDYGSGVICFRNLDQPAKYQSSEWAFILVDELTKNVYDTFTFLRTRLRWPDIPDDQCFFIGATNPGGVGHCLDKAEVLTPDGWKDISSFQTGDPVYTVTSNGEMVETVISQVHKRKYSGPLMRVSSRGFYMSCTPNHSVAKKYGKRNGKNTRDKVSDVFSLVPFNELPGQATILRTTTWIGKRIDSFSVPQTGTRKRKLCQPKRISGDDYAELMGWMLSEGYTLDRDKMFAIAQSKKPQRHKIEKLLKRCGFYYRSDATGFMVYAADWWEYFRKFGKCRDKYLPKSLKSASTEQLGILLTALMDGDGHWSERGKSGTFYSFSKKLADDFAEIAVKSGFVVFSGFRKKKDRKGNEYRVSIKKTKSGGTEILTRNHVYSVQTKTKRRSKIWSEEYSGNVYCLGVDRTHTFIVRQKGAVWISGNSWVKSFWMDKTFPPEFYEPVDYTTKFAYVPAKADDNPHLDEAYWAMLNTLPENLRAAFRDGDWDIFVGQAFPEFTQTYHVEKPRQVPDFARLYMTYDFGFGAPYSCGYWWVDEDGRLHRFAELYGAVPGGNNHGLRQADSEQAEKIKAFENTLGVGLWDESGNAARPITRYCDPTCFNKKPDYKGGGQGPATAEIFRNYGIEMVPGDPHRHLKKRQFHERLRVRSELDPETGDQRIIQPMMVVSSDCKDFIRTIPNLQIDENDIEDVATDGEDHCLCGDTEVVTSSGPVKIKNLVGKTGVVLTAGGLWTTFYNCRKTIENAETVEVIFEDGRSIACTPDHRFLTNKGLWVEAKDLTDEACHVSMPSNINFLLEAPCELKSLMKRHKSLMGNATGCAGSISNERGCGCTGKCGSITMGLSKKDSTSTIKTRTFQTIKSKTLNQNPAENTCPCTQSKTIMGHGSLQCITEQGLGTKATRAALGIGSNTKSTAKRQSRLQKEQGGASFVGRNLPDPNIKNTVQGNASSEAECSDREKKGFVPFAGLHILDSDALVQKLVLQSSHGKSVKVVEVRPAGDRDVYCLDAAITHAFAVAGGIVVHNCYDEAALMCMARPLALNKEEEKQRAEAEKLRVAREKLDSTSKQAWDNLDDLRQQYEDQAEAERDAFSDMFEGF